VQDANGNTDSDQVSITVQSPAPGSFTVDAGANEVVNSGQVLNFTAEVSNAPGDVAYQWSVDFGGATLADTAQATVTATAPIIEGASVLMVQATSDGETVRDFVFLHLREALSLVLDDNEVSVAFGEVASLQAIASGGQPPYGFEWIQTSGVAATTSKVSTGVTSTLSVNLQEAGQATFRVTVIDSLESTAFAEGTVIAASDDEDGDGDLSVDAGADVSIELGEATTLEGTVAGGTSPYSYQWNQVSGPTAVLSSSASLSTTVIINATGDAVLRLSVTDAEGETASDEVIVTTLSGGDGNLRVDAGEDQTLGSSDVVSFFGSVSGNEGQVSYAWSLIDWPGVEPVVSILSPTSASTQVLFSNQPNSGDYVFQLKVTELTTGLSASDEVTVTVSN
jgi:hypothetical protein